MELLKLEHKKLWRRKIVKISVLLCFIYTVLFGNVLSYQWFTFGTSKGNMGGMTGNRFDGYKNIRDSQEYADRWGGEVNDEAIQEMVRDYQRLEQAKEKTDYTEYSKLTSWVEMSWPELKDPGTYQLIISYVNSDELNGFYERRQKALEDFLESSGQVGAEKDFLLRMDEKVKKPYRYEWTAGWSVVLGSMVGDLGKVTALVLAVALSTLFAGEWHDRMGYLVLTTKNGWKKAAYAKIGTGILFSVELFLLMAVPCVVVQVFFLGTSGWDMPIQNIKMIAVAPFNMLQAEIYEYAFAMLGGIGFSIVVMLTSAAVKNNFLAVLCSLAAVYGPMAIADYLPYKGQVIIDLLPLVGSATDIFRTYTFCVFGHYIWSPYLLITAPLLIGLCCMPLAVKRWARRMKV